MDLLKLHKETGDKLTAEEVNRIGRIIDEHSKAIENGLSRETVADIQEGHIVQMRNDEGEKEFPITDFRAVVMADGETNLEQRLASKVSKVKGKGLSTNDFTDELKTKLEHLSDYDYDKLLKAVQELEARLDQLADEEFTQALERIKVFLADIPLDKSFNTILAELESKITAKIPVKLSDLQDDKGYLTEANIQELKDKDLEHDIEISQLKQHTKKFQVEGETLYVLNV